MEHLVRLWLSGAAFVAAVVLGTAAIVDADGGDTTVIHACLNQYSGTLRIVVPNGACTVQEMALHWPTVERIAAVESRIVAIESKDASQDSLLSALVSRVSSLESKDASHDSLLSALVNRVSNLESHDVSQDSLLSALVSRVGNIESKNASQDSLLSALVSQVSNLESAISAREVRVPLVEALGDMDIATMEGIPPGAYLFLAKARATNSFATGVNCYLQVTQQVGEGWEQVAIDGGWGSFKETLNMQTTAMLASTGRAVFHCSSDEAWNAQLISIIALRLLDIVPAE